MAKGMKQRKKHITLEDVEYKQCSRCLEPKPLDCFGKDKTRWDFLCPVCKKCRKAGTPVTIDVTQANPLTADVTH